MNLFEEQLKKIFNNTNIDCFGNSCYIDLNGDLYAKVEFVSYIYKPAYDSLKITIISKRNGIIDNIILVIADIIDFNYFIIKENLGQGEFEFRLRTGQLKSNDYTLIRNKIQKFINFFKCN